MSATDTKRQSFLLAFYGDDFTGSTDSMEALTVNGLRTVLFLDVPDPAILHERFPDLQCFGVAGISRSLSPAEMESELVPKFERLRALDVPLIHYKVCSTFDSAPRIGSIGKVMDIARDIFVSQRTFPLLVGAPALRRYTLFGNHFATTASSTYRLDRHPTMSKHPVTPMDEADLRKHLGRQTKQTIALFDIVALDGEDEDVRDRFARLLENEPDAVLFDVLDDERLERAGSLIWEETKNGQQFVVGSSGVEYAMAAHYNRIGVVRNAYIPQPTEALDQLLVLSGSCSPITQSQIEYALGNGFEGLKVRLEPFVGTSDESARERLFRQASAIIERGKSLVVYSAIGPDDPSIAETKSYLEANGVDAYDTSKILGRELGVLAQRLVRQIGLKRILIAGGDTSGYVTKELGIYGLEMIAPIDPGAPLCRCYSQDAAIDGLQIALKGGQFGHPDFFVRVMTGETLNRSGDRG